MTGLNKFLIAVGIVWFIMFLLHLPWINVPHLVPFKDFCSFSGMVVMQLMAYFFSFYGIRRIERSELRDDLKGYPYMIIDIFFQKSILVFFLIVHFLFIISWPG